MVGGVVEPGGLSLGGMVGNAESRFEPCVWARWLQVEVGGVSKVV